MTPPLQYWRQRKQVRDTAVGAFSPIETREGVASSFFVLDEQRPEVPPYDEIRPFVTREFALERRARAVSKLLDTYFDGTSTEFSFD